MRHTNQHSHFISKWDEGILDVVLSTLDLSKPYAVGVGSLNGIKGNLIDSAEPGKGAK